MRIVLTQNQLSALRSYLFDQPGVEGAAFLLCGQYRNSTVQKLLCHSIAPIADHDYLLRAPDKMAISSRALMRATKRARTEGLSIIFAHSHPNGLPAFSAQDDAEEQQLMPFLHSRIPHRIHGTLVLSDNSIAARIYIPQRVDNVPVLVIGDRISIESHTVSDKISPAFDRQVRAFGTQIQTILSSLHVGVVGLGGTGSPLAEQLYRLGIGELSLFDGDSLEASNINRVYGSSVEDIGKPKVDIAKRHLDRIGLGTPIHSIPQHITSLAAAQALAECDIVFGCTDKQIPRAILIQLMHRYLVPVFDLGVLIDSRQGKISGIHGRVTTLIPGEACLFCRGRISPEMMRVEALSPEERKGQIQEGYAPELEEPAPAVISFTSSIASAAISEFLHRLTGFMGEERTSSEIIYRFDATRIHTNRVTQRDTCVCADTSTLAVGDEIPFLGVSWPTHTK